MKKKFLLIDANSLIHRSFHAIPPLTAKDGRPTGALYGVAGALLKIIAEHKPDYAAAAFDRPEPTFRKEMFRDYKAHRPKAPDELISQIIEAHELFKKFGINFFEQPGYEADDVIGTFVKKFKNKGTEITILTGDLDTLQLVDDGEVVVQILKKGVSETALYDEKAVKERYGLEPEQMTDYKGLVGDTSDNIPGVKGVGPKTAETWLKTYGNLENLFKKMPADDPSAKKILPFKKEALFSKELATINQNAPIKADEDDVAFGGVPKETLTPYFAELGFESLIRRMNGEPKKITLSERKTAKKEKPLTQGLFAFDSGKGDGKPEPVFVGDNEKMKAAKGGHEIDVAWEWKPIMKDLIRKGKELPPRIFDLGIAGWVLSSEEADFSPEALAARFLKGADGTDKAAAMKKLFRILEKKIGLSKLENVFYKIEMPLVPILAQMELWGIRADRTKLEKLRAEMDKKVSELTKNIYAAAGGEFNINSSQQLAEVLFEKLKIRPEKNRKTSTGRRSTSEEVLSALEKDNPIASEILDYRETFKIRSTYVEPLSELAGKDGRIRTTFVQTGTTTGRLSSEKPNLQNVPQESEWAKPLRDAFVSEPGFSLASFDYAQLELRLLAHMTLEEGLIKAFEEGQDIHTLTASRILKVPLNKVTKQERRLGKTLNFGVVYGMGPRAFAQSAGVGFDEAKRFIDGYFREFPKIRKWQDKVKTEAKKRGYVENLNGRRRWFWSGGENPRALGEIERAAINMPLQSLGADILKMAMIRSFELLREKDWFGEKARLMLSIHDELLFEIRDDILRESVPLIKDLMEQIYPLAAPLAAEAKTGKAWGSLKDF